MELPSSIRVGAYDIEVQWWRPVYANDRERFGEFSQYEQAIRIDRGLKPQKLLDTVLHELNHAVYWIYGLKDEDEEERVVQVYATAWTQIWRDNPDFHEWVGKIAYKCNFKEFPKIREIRDASD